MTRAVVFAYHSVGARCLSTLLAHGVEVALLVTHEDAADENIWFESVAAVAARHDIPTITPADANTPELLARIAALQPDFIFSFYYRKMLGTPLLALAARGAYNMHGSLLPKYRGRAPVNWAVLHGETETGASLHEMLAKPDAGRVVAQQRVPILPDDTAFEVFNKVTVAAELALDAVLPALLAGTAPHFEQNLAQGGYFGGRKPADGRIDWTQPAAVVHNLVRAVAPPYPGAFFEIDGVRLIVGRSQLAPPRQPRSAGAGIYVEDARFFADCADGRVLRLLSLTLDGQELSPAAFVSRFGETLANGKRFF
ncbi:formyltransferase [Rhodocyclus tenuis]|uniref:Methionyl-tRNA formyltransferase n=1 Tax=Rhodocyclus tenuis TaxID=1066 RepID=A0A840G9C7_RHOTE|nr:formyltransferase [Rhodocyclus tenuis]MBB4248446.1 methionyl-tRNA formyltransferase [Rhodocyclus tenuis]